MKTFVAVVLVPLSTFRRRVKVRFRTKENEAEKILAEAAKEAAAYYGDGAEVEKIVEDD